MFSFLAKIFGVKETSDEDSVSLQKLITLNAMDRRANIRVSYPDVGAVGGLPSVKFKGQLIQVADVSVGGLCLIDKNNVLGQSVGQKATFTLLWADEKVDVTAMIVGVNLDRRHIQFMDLSAVGLVRLSLLLKPGFLGTKFRQVPKGESAVNLVAEEVWLAPTGETVIFFTPTPDQEFIAEISFQYHYVQILPDYTPVHKATQGNVIAGQRVDEGYINQLLVCLANFHRPTENIKNLINNLQAIISMERSA